MAQVNFTVDTHPMAQKIDGVAAEVGVLGTAVTAMQAAVVASEKRASEKICQSIDGGFYMLLRSRLSQRVAQFSSTMNSRVGSMMETASAIEHTHEQMQGDFNRIKARYVKLFSRLDRSLEKRVRELDKDAMLLAQQRDVLLTQRQCSDAPAALYYSADISKVALKASNASLKKKAVLSIDQLGKEAQHIIRYKQMTSSVFETRRHADASSSELPFYYVPVVYAVTENLATPGSYAMQVQTPGTFDPKTQSELAVRVRHNQDRLKGSNGGDLFTIRTSYSNKVEQSRVDARTAQTMMALFDTSFKPSRGSATDYHLSAEQLQANRGGAQGGDGR